jgi:DNA-binding response OmpR family regulator
VFRRQHVLIVQTDAQIRRLIERWLLDAGHAVIPAGEPQAHVPASPDLVIADAGPAPADPVRCVNALRSTHRAPVLLISARFRRGLMVSREAAQRLGVQAVLPTPFSHREFLEAVGTATSGRE